MYAMSPDPRLGLYVPHIQSFRALWPPTMVIEKLFRRVLVLRPVSFVFLATVRHPVCAAVVTAAKSLGPSSR